MEENKRTFKPSMIIYPLVLLLIAGGLFVAIAYSRHLHPKEKEEFDKKLGYNVDDYITLGKYKGLEVEQEKVNVTDEDVEYEIEDALTEEVEIDGELKEGDYANVNISATSDGAVVEDLSYDDFDICIGDEDYVVELDEAMVGKKSGDAFNVSVADAGNIDDGFEGQAVDLYVVVNSAYNYKENELTDEYAKENFDCDTADEYIDSVRKQLEEDAKEDNEYAMKEELYTMAVDNAEMKGYPDDLYDEVSSTAYDSIVEDAEEWDMADDIEGFLETFYEKDESQSLQDFLEEYYKETIKDRLVLYAIAKAENLSVTDEKYDELIKQYLIDYEFDSAEDMEEEYGKDEIKEAMLSDIVYDFLAENAVITFVEPSEDDDEFIDDEEVYDEDEYDEDEYVDDVEGDEYSEDDEYIEDEDVDDIDDADISGEGDVEEP